MLVVLRYTSNPKYQNIVGYRGSLVEKGGSFYFHFVDSYGNRMCLNSKICGRLGDLINPRSDEVVYRTRNSEYIFRKLDNVVGGCFDWVRR